ncbi:MAG: sugar phosphate isomerase/epimerase, partial [bacterium]|nr:sugar phosphate isomerase/epimerase [bacterium]
MNEPVRKYIKVGLIHFMAYPEVIKGEGPILETLEEIAKDDYFDVVEVTWIKDQEIREKAKEMLE